MQTVRDLFGEDTGGEIIISPGEYAGPIVVDRACTIKGNMSVIWADSPTLGTDYSSRMR